MVHLLYMKHWGIRYVEAFCSISDVGRGLGIGCDMRFDRRGA
jgi:hypothetical protein